MYLKEEKEEGRSGHACKEERLRPSAYDPWNRHGSVWVVDDPSFAAYFVDGS
jgi:hypothetical protein